ncbi:Nucleotidylyl transferase [Ramaria rubella]|nr:Nucleotidylyl transferase [Ramaria rubella]
MDPYALTLEHFVKDHTLQSVELIYTSHPSWPLPPHSSTGRILNLCVLDSSFNPPTMAHLALACLPFLPNSSSPSPSFSAKLLLFSIKNADKTLKPGDATPSQRLQMMIFLAHELQRIGEQNANHSSQNIAVGVCREPTFVGKSAVLLDFFHDRLATLSPSTNVRLTFLLGFDTLERLFAPRYYSSEDAMKEALRRLLSPSGDDSRIICARRRAGESYAEVDNNIVDIASNFIDSGAVVLTDIGEAERALSSSEVRKNITDASDNWMHKVPESVAAYIKENHLYAKPEAL